MRRLQGSMAIALLSLCLAGCGSRMGQVYGKITYKGEPVTAGSISFAPKAPEEQFEAGRPASGAPDANGEFQLSTFKQHDGALVGPHVVIYLAPGNPETVDPELRAKRRALFAKFGKCKLPDNYVVEVKPGRNDITLELTQ